MQQKKEREKILKMKEERRRQAAREKLGKDQTHAQDQETKEQKQSRQVILHRIEDQLDERTLKVAFEKYLIEVSLNVSSTDSTWLFSRISFPLNRTNLSQP